MKAAVPLVVAVGHLRSYGLQGAWVRRIRRGEQPPWRAVDAKSFRPTAGSTAWSRRGSDRRREYRAYSGPDRPFLA